MARGSLFLCGGLQSSGSTLVSWCFLQRPDMDGILDARFDAIPELPSSMNPKYPWCKFTVSCFRFSEIQSHFEDDGWTVQPLLIARDVRAVFNSLINKSYGRNGLTADDPPLRTRLRRFLADYQTFRERGWPILIFEDFVRQPEQTLQAICQKMNLPWDEAMISWPKSPEQIADPRHGNATFMQTRGGGLLSSVNANLIKVGTKHIPPGDLEWMEQEFVQMNRELGYPDQIAPDASIPVTETRAIPRFELTRRYERQQRKHKIRRLIRGVGQAVTGMWNNPPGQNPPSQDRPGTVGN